MIEPIYQELFEQKPGRLEKRKLQILESAVKVLSRQGWDGFSFEQISKEGGFTRPLMHHYFNSRDQLLHLIVQYVHFMRQAFLQERIHAATTAKDQLNAYMQACLDWPEISPSQAKVWMMFLQIASLQPDFQQKCTDWVDADHEFLANLYQKAQQELGLASDEPLLRAKQTQLTLMGTFQSFMTEKWDPETRSFLKKTILEKCGP